MKFKDRLVNAWNVLTNKSRLDNIRSPNQPITNIFSSGMHRYSFDNERSIINAVMTRIAIDVASYDITHVLLDDTGRYKETVNDGLQRCLSLEANKDQTGRAFIQDVCMSMFDEGCIAMVPVDVDRAPITDSYDILSMRTARITDWYPDYIRVSIYNDRTGNRESLEVPKSYCGIVYNPLYSIMNSPNSTLKRLVHKLGLLDAVDNQSSSGKLDIILQLPGPLRTDLQKDNAKIRKKDIEEQLKDSQYGIAYLDGAERITQLNRPSENNLLAQVQYLTTLLYSQLGITEDIFNGTASEQTLRNYYDRTVEPIVLTIVEEMRRKFLTQTARTRGHSILGFKDMLKLIPANELATIADVFSRNEILTPNEIRQTMGLKPSKEPQADELRNKNMPIQEEPSEYTEQTATPVINAQSDYQNYVEE